MPLMLDNMRAEFAHFLSDDPAGRYRMDKALAHTITIAYERGLDDGRRSHDQRFDDGGKHILDTYYALHANRLIGTHWLWSAIERIAAGENEAEVMSDLSMSERNEWSQELTTLHEGSQDWHVVCMMLAEEVRRLRDAGNEAANALRQEATILRDSHTLNGEWNDDDMETQAHYDQMLALADRLTPPGLTPNAEETRSAEGGADGIDDANGRL